MTHKPTTLLIARHGEARCNQDQTIGGTNGCRGLTDHGHVQVRQLATWLRSHHPGLDALYASPLRRATQSAAILAATLGLPVTMENDLREQDHGDADGQPWAEALAAFRGISALEADRPLAPGGETWRAYLDRTTAALARILDRHPGQQVLVVGHGQTADAAFHLFLRLPATSQAQAAFMLHPTALSIWQQQPLAWTQPAAGWRWTLVAHNLTVTVPDA